MKIHKLFSICLACLILLSCFIGAPEKPSRAQAPDVPSSATAPPGYVVSKPQEKIDSTLAGADILLIQTALPWESDADLQVLNSLGYSYDIVDITNLGSVDMFSYQVVLIVNDQVQAFYDLYAQQVDVFEDYVSSGHTLIFFAASDGWAGGTLTAPLPGGVQVTTPWLDYYNFIVAASHPIITAQLSDGIPLTDADLYNTWCSHGYFSSLPEGTTVILEESNGLPTLIEYKLGTGRVIASTQTWEHSWLYWEGYFGDKALDDVFLYALSGGATPAGVQMNLVVEDAPSWATVNKSRGSYLDIVARVTGDQAFETSVVLSIPSDKFGVPNKTFTRNYPGDPVVGQENQYTNLGSGQYKITSTLHSFAGKYYKELVWRFKLADTVVVEQNIGLTATVSVKDHFVFNPTKSAALNVIDYARSLIVTNRKLLFSKYMSDPAKNDVSTLLEDAYIQAEANEGEVFYVDLYSDSAKNWNQVVDYTTEASANTVCTAVDNLINGWYDRLTKRPYFWLTLKPEFLLIIGGDEVIPFYRVDDRPYGDDEFTLLGTIDNNDPTGMMPQQHYMLSDNIYADVGGDKSDWEEGDLELSMGRIIGHSAKSMHSFMWNAWLSTPPLSQAVMASRSESHNLDTVREVLNSRHVAIYGETDPDLTENDDWTRDQWLTALQQPYQVLAYQGHGAYNGWAGTDSWASIVSAADQPAGRIADNNPLFVVEACNFAFPTDLDGSTWKPEVNDNISYKLVSLGAGGIFGSTGIAYIRTGDQIAFAERLHNDYFKNLIDTSFWLNTLPLKPYSEYFGTAMLKAKQEYPGNAFLGGFDSTDKKTLMEFVYYGLPWSFVRTPDNAVANLMAEKQLTKGFTISSKVVPDSVTDSFSKVITANITSYQFSLQDEFELLEIPGSDTLYSLYKPVVPVIYTTFSLPLDAVVSGIELVSEHAVPLGQHNLPAADPDTFFEPTTGYTSTMDVTGVYPPAPRFGYRISSFGDRLEIQVSIAPATFNVDTKDVILYDNTEVRVNYTSAVPVVIGEFVLDKPEYEAGEAITGRASIENVSSELVSLVGTLLVTDESGTVITSSLSSYFDIPGGGTYTLEQPLGIELPSGNYNVSMLIEKDGYAQGSSSQTIRILDGRIASFTSPNSVTYGKYSAFEVSFENFSSLPIVATAKIYIYDLSGVEAASLLQRTFVIDGDSTGSTSWLWDPAGLPLGQYNVRAVVQTTGGVFASDFREMQVLESGYTITLLPFVVK